MNKLAIPAILAATVMVAGLFAFAPVEQASTVHTGTGSQLGLIIVTDSGTGITDGDRIVFDCDKDFTVREILFTVTNLETVTSNSEVIDLGADDGAGGDPDFPMVEIDGVPLTDENGDFEEESFISSSTDPNADPTVTWTGFAEDEDEEETPYILFAEGEGTDDIVMYLFDDGANPLDGDEELTVKALFVTQSNAVCTVDVDTNP